MTYCHKHSVIFRSRKRIKSAWRSRWAKPVNMNPLSIFIARMVR